MATAPPDRRDRYRELYELVVSTRTSAGLTETLSKVAGAAAQIVPGAHVDIWELTGQHLRLVKTAPPGTCNLVEGQTMIGLGDGLIGPVIAERRLLIVEDVTADPRVFNLVWLRASGYVGYVGVPLVSGGTLVGGLSLFTPARAVWAREAVELLQAFAALAAGLLREATLFDEVVAGRRLAERLAEALRAMGESQNLERVVRRFADGAIQLADGVGAVVRLRRPDGSLEQVAAAGDAVAWFPRGHIMPPGVGLVRHVVTTGRSLNSPDFRREPDLEPNLELGAEVGGLLDPERHGAVAAVPIGPALHPIGVLLVFRARGRGYAAGELQALESLAQYGARAVAHARSHRQARVRAKRLQAIVDTTQFLLRADGVDATLSAIVAAAGELTKSSFVTVWVADDRRGVVTRRAASNPALAARQPAHELAYGTGIVGWVAVHRQHLHIPDLQSDTRPFNRDWHRQHGFTSALAMPMIAEGRLIGVAAMLGRAPFALSHAEQELLEGFLAEAALALRQAETVEALRLTVGRLEESQQRLADTERMRALGQVAAGVAHDFNAMLTLIKSPAQLLAESLPPDDPAQDLIAMISRSATRAGALVNQLSAFGRRREDRPELLDLRAVLEAARPMLARIVGEGVDLTLTVAETLPPVLGHSGEVEQVLLNLVSNARDALPSEGGRIDIHADELVATAAQPRGLAGGRHVTLSVTDNGFGMDAATLERASEPFFTTKGPGRGTGLGLTSVLTLATQYGGTTTVDSAPGQGTCVTVFLPAAVPDRVPGPDVEPAEPSLGGSETILLVEDDADLRSHAAQLLAKRGYTVLEAEDAGGADTLATAHDGRIDLLLSDVALPGTSGVELAARLTPLRPGMRRLFMSGHRGRELADLGFESGCGPLLAKPWDALMLLASVRRTLDSPAATPGP